MKGLLRRTGVDLRQWRALLRAHATTDYAALAGAYGPAERRRASGRFVLGAAVFSLIGTATAVLAGFTADAFLAATFVVGSASLWGAMIALPNASALVLADDYDIIGFRPVTPASYLASRLTCLAITALEIAFWASWSSVIVFGFRADGGLAAAAALALGVTGATITSAMLIAVVYVCVLRALPPRRLSIATAVIAASGVIAALSVVLIATRQAAGWLGPSTSPLTLDASAWTAAVPYTWWASYVPLATGRGDRFLLTIASASIAIPLVLAALLSASVSTRYFARMARAATDGPPARKQRLLALPQAITGEARAMALLGLAHLRRDVTFQLNVLTNLAMVGVLIGMSAWDSLPPDPFVEGGRRGPQTVSMAVAIAVASLYRSAAVSTEHAGSWIFFVAPSARAALVRAGAALVAALGWLPSVLLGWAYLAYAWGHAGHAALQMAFAGVTGLAVLQLQLLIRPLIPFSRPVQQGGGAGLAFGRFLIVLPLVVAAGLLLDLWGYGTMRRSLAALGLLLLWVGLIERLLARILPRRAGSIVYLG